MNFFGHAVVATWQSAHPGFVLGAMLPDFATMIGARVPSVNHADVASGVRFHHDTDRVFHDAPTFRSLQADARRTLREQGLPRPCALAVGHIGVEILLDSALGDDPRGRAGYEAALAAGHPNELGAHVEWATPGEVADYGRLVSVLAERGIPSEAQSPSTSAWRIARALAPRPRLRLDADGERLVREWAEIAAPVIALAARELVQEILRGLETAGASLDMRPPGPGPSV
ncbi:MAG TPA: hypothetical protein VF395_19150 [Polyangiaceae bacterium]